VRLFFALWPGEGVRAQLARWSRELHAVCGGRQTRTENLHLTLAFLGNVNDARVADVDRAAGEVVLRAGVLVLDQPGYWKRNRIAWAGASAAAPELEDMVRELRGALARSRVDFDTKPFATHVTLLREAREPQAMPALAPVAWALDGYALVRSPDGRGGPYEVLGSWGLRSRR
jgi:RNA 2',3'-cyclic 3'-phosphodiesterase